ncbi:MAG TPA: polyhydroxyalkanoate depolymerase [Rhodobacteraceae bacterium]|nr:polyhydroxyalkanoate depolymerase [Paracoccaceae bacterium]
MLYHLYELNHAAISPLRQAVRLGQAALNSPFNPASLTLAGKTMAAGLDVLERTTRRYGKPEFNISSVRVNGAVVAIREEIPWQKPFCRLLHFKKQAGVPEEKSLPLLIVAPMSGHYATLLRGTVAAMLPDHDVFITDWTDARQVPLSEGDFGFDDYITYIIDMISLLGPQVHVMAVCQPSVQVLAATALLEAEGKGRAPASITLMGGPVDTGVNPTAVNRFAQAHSLDWFRRHAIATVPFPHRGFMRSVYPGFLQLSGFLGMNPDRHLEAHRRFFRHLIEGDEESASRHEAFYDEYLAVMDLDAGFYLQTLERVFMDPHLARGRLSYRGQKVEPAAIRHTALMTVEGELDDISGPGQTRAAHDLCTGLPEKRRRHHMQKGVGHYGVFNGSRFISDIAPAIGDFIRDSV